MEPRVSLTNDVGETPKSSFFVRMWGSLRTQNNNQIPERKNVVVGMSDEETKESDIHDIPAFLRKKRD